MRIAIIGAGFAGLSAAKVLTEFGHKVTVFDKAPDVGGVWSRTRRYPGVTTQNNRDSYAFSDFPMPTSYPEWPSGEQVQKYLANYVRHFALKSYLQLNTEVTHADLDRTRGLWTLEVRPGSVPDHDGSGGVVGVSASRGGAGANEGALTFEYLVVANGIFSDPLIPDYPGIDEFAQSGGRLCHSTEFTNQDGAKRKAVVIDGCGKSACDIAVSVSDTAASTTVVARKLLWKMPKRLANLLNYKYLMLTRLGEALFPYIEVRGFERALHGPGRIVRDGLIKSIESLVTRQLGLVKLGLVPDGNFADIANSSVSLVSDGFYKRIANGRIVVRRGSVINRLLAQNGSPSAELVTGEIIPADIVIAATGFQQRVPFLAEDIQEEITDERGNFEIYRQILPHTVPKIAFVGYNSSFFSPLSAEVAAIWIGNYLNGLISLPPLETRRSEVQKRLRWMEKRTHGNHARGTNIIPFSMHNIDEMLSDLGVDVSRATRLKQWLLPIEPGAYSTLAEQLRRREPGGDGPRANSSSEPAPLPRRKPKPVPEQLVTSTEDRWMD